MFTFNGQTPADFGLTVEALDNPAMSERTINLVQIPGYAGAQYGSTADAPRSFAFSLAFPVSDRTTARATEAAVAVWLSQGQGELEIDDDQPVGGTNRAYTVRLSGAVVWSGTGIRRCSVAFVTIGAPYAHDVTEGADIALPANTAVVVNNPGTAPAFPRWITSVSASTAQLSLTADADTYITLGDPPESGMTAATDALVLSEDMDDISDWATGTSCDGGTVTGTMAVVNGYFKATSFGTGSLWHGPTRRRSLSASAAHWRVTLDVALSNGASGWVARSKEATALTGTTEHIMDGTGAVNGGSIVVTSSNGKTKYYGGRDFVWTCDGTLNKMRRTANSRIPSGATVLASYTTNQGALTYDRGRAECYLLDGSGVKLGKLGICDISNQKPVATLFAEVGGVQLVATANKSGYKVGRSWVSFNDSTMRLVLERRSNLIKLTAYKSVNGKWSKVAATVAAYPNGYTAAAANNLAAIDLHLGQYGTDTVCDMSFKGLWVSSLAVPSASQYVPAFAAGDVVEVDLGTGRVLLNDEDRIDLLNLDSSLFPLMPGDNVLTFKTDGTASSVVAFTPRYL